MSKRVLEHTVVFYSSNSHLTVISATARSNRFASVYMAQDFAQLHDMFGREKAEVIIANLSNQFYGKVSSVPTTRGVSEMIGKVICLLMGSVFKIRMRILPIFQDCS